MSDDRCFCGAEWVDEREECAAGHGFGEADRFRERAEKAEARVAVLEAALSPIAAQAKGYSIALSDEHRNGHCTIVLTTAQLRMARDLLTRDSHNEKTEGD